MCSHLLALMALVTLIFNYFYSRPNEVSEDQRDFLQNNVLKVEWERSSGLSQIPSLNSLFPIVKSINSWCDVSVDNIVILHCPGASPRSGLVAACWLKYIGACKSMSLAYEYVCNLR